jgi:selenocysteine lyase/cysteine desulfurase
MTNRKRPNRTASSRRQFFGDAVRFAAAAGLASLGLGNELAQAVEQAASSPTSLPRSPEEARSAMLLPKDLAYFNCGTLGPSPRCVLEESFEAWRKMEQDPADEGFGTFLGLAEQTRAKAAKLLGCQKDEIVITRNTTEGMNTVAQGLDWQKGDRVLTTDHEHEGGSVCWKYFAKRSGVEIDRITLPMPPGKPAEVLALLEAKLTRRTRVISVSHITFTTGLRMPLPQIAAMAKANGSLLVVDGAQAAGALDVDVKALGCDAYSTSGHKWLLGPKGTGILYIRKESADKFQPLLLDQGRSVYTTSAGTANLIGVIGLGLAIDFLAGVGKDKFQKHNMELAAYLYAKLKGLSGVRIVSPATGELSSPLVSVTLGEKADNAAVAARLREKHRIVVKLLPKEVTNGLRFSCHVYNNEEDCDRLVAALKQEL